MPFTTHEMDELETLLRECDDGPQTVAQFRIRFPGKSLTRCPADEMGMEPPYRSYGAFDLHLVDGRGHCWRFTADPGAATGIVLARRKAA